MGPRLRRALLGCALALAVATATLASATLVRGPAEVAADASGSAGGEPQGWVAGWGVALAGPGPAGSEREGFTDVTLRQLLRVSIGGDTVRVRLANTFGDRPLRLAAATVAPAAGGPGSPLVTGGAPRELRFGGSPDVVVAPGASVASDPVDLAVPDGAALAVSLHLPGPTGPTTRLPSGFATSYVAAGDATADDGGAFEALDTARYYLTGVDVVAPDAEGAVVLVGDSITAGADSTLDADRRYPDVLARRLLDEHVRRCGVVNAGIGGNRLLPGGASSEPVPARLGRDVLDVPGATSVVVLAGINDIGGSRGQVDAARLIAAHRQVVRRVHAAGLRAVGATLLPYDGAGYATEAGEAERRAVNRWLRRSGTYDAVLDLDRVMRDPDRPARLWPEYDSGDHLHPNDAGLAVLADAVDLDAVC